MLATEDDRGFQLEKRSLELEKLKEDLEEREKAVAKRAKDADDSAELLEREKVRKLGFGGVRGRWFALCWADLLAMRMTQKSELFLPIFPLWRVIHRFFQTVKRDVASVRTDVQTYTLGS